MRWVYICDVFLIHMICTYVICVLDFEAVVFRRAYYAAVSYTDHLIGLVLDELDALGLRNSTGIG